MENKDKEIETTARKATKWSFITEIAAKTASPVVNMILARLLAPDAFGVVATVTMITSFADIFSDAGFQKYLIQAEFASREHYTKSTYVAFWTNLAISFFLWGMIFIFREPLSASVGNPGLGYVFSVACVSLPLTSFSSIQMSIFKRNLDFKTLFYARLAGVLTPIFVTIPLAFITRSFWSMIIGTIATNLANAVVLTFFSRWVPKLFFSFKILKEMFSFCILTLIEQILGWANLNIGIFIVGLYFDSYYLGIYKTSMSMVNQLIALFTGAITPVLFSALSRLKNEPQKRNQMFLKYTRISALILLPMGVGIFVFRELGTQIVLGNQWGEAAGFLGLWALVRCWRIIFGYYGDMLIFAIGKPKYNVLSQVIQIIILLPVLFIVAPMGFKPLYIARSIVQMSCAIVDIILIWIVVRISIIELFKHTYPYIACALIMGGVAEVLEHSINSFLGQILVMVLCAVFYFVILYSFKLSRNDLKELIKIVRPEKF